MTNLEQLAQDLFHEYTRKENKVASWKYLNNQRKIEWMQEVLLIWSKLLADLKSQIRPADTSPQSGIYAMGYNEAIKKERSDFVQLLERTNETLKNQLDKFITISKETHD